MSERQVMTRDEFIEDLRKRLRENFAMEIETATPNELFVAIGQIVRASYADSWHRTRQRYLEHKQKQSYYFSIEFLPGRILKSNLLSLGMLDMVRDTVEDFGFDFDDVLRVENDMALGNGGLGRLASCFLDCLASRELPGNGNGIRYDYGLFKQQFVDGYQVELPDAWLKSGNVWEVCRESESVNVHFGGNVYMKPMPDGSLKPVAENERILKAVPYDTGVVGYENDTVNTLRLWSVEIPASEEGKYRSIEERRMVEDLTAVLYPDDSNEQGRLTRLTQEYFFVSAGIQSIIRYYKKTKMPISRINEYIAIHINDTHPALCVPEMMRILLDEFDLSWEKAWGLTVSMMSYTNHTIMQEALEKWPVSMVKYHLPRMYQIIEEIDRRFVTNLQGLYPDDLIQRTRIIQGDQIHMANLSIIGSHSTNGVAKLHSDLLKSVVLHDFYVLYPERFNNKTNGITQRRWLQLSNEPLANLLDETIGTSWRKEPTDLQMLMNYYDDDRVLELLADAKHKNKVRLAKYIKETCNIEVNPNAVFDVQIKRLHAYKRQLLNLLHIVKCYLDLKDDPNRDFVPRVWIFGAKAAPSYTYAKSIIKAINETANLINNDPDIGDKMKIVFLPNYNVSLAEIIIPAADVSEQISLATKEASGTSNMKLMANGAVTMATMDGANVEIRDYVGADNIYVFGLTEEEVYRYYEKGDYSAQDIYDQDPVVRRVLNAFVDGTIPNIQREGQEIFDSLLKYNDEFFLLKDFEPYCKVQEQVSQDYLDQTKWRKMSLTNTAKSGIFSADYTVMKYAEDIWQIEPVNLHKEKRN